MFSKNKIKTMLVLLAVMCLAFSCKKEDTKATQEQKETLCDEICRGGSPQHNDSLSFTHITPSCITAMMQDPEYEFWDFDNMVHFHEFDTAGFYTYFVPAIYFSESNFLCVTVKDGEVALNYGMMFPTNFDYQTYYNQNLTAYVSILSYDYEEVFYEGYLNVRDRSFLVTYVNPLLIDDDLEALPLWHWKDMNLCEKILTGVEIVWDAGFAIGTGGIGGFIAGTANGIAFEFMRRKAC